MTFYSNIDWADQIHASQRVPKNIIVGPIMEIKLHTRKRAYLNCTLPFQAWSELHRKLVFETFGHCAVQKAFGTPPVQNRSIFTGSSSYGCERVCCTRRARRSNVKISHQRKAAALIVQILSDNSLVFQTPRIQMWPGDDFSLCRKLTRSFFLFSLRFLPRCCLLHLSIAHASKNIKIYLSQVYWLWTSFCWNYCIFSRFWF